MPRGTLCRIAEGRDIQPHYRGALEIWDEVLGDKDPLTESKVESASVSQMRFERECGGRFIGQEIMVISGVLYFYDEDAGFNGDRPLAEALLRNLYHSKMSTKVKFHVEDVAELFNLDVD